MTVGGSLSLRREYPAASMTIREKTPCVRREERERRESQEVGSFSGCTETSVFT